MPNSSSTWWTRALTRLASFFLEQPPVDGALPDNCTCTYGWIGLPLFGRFERTLRPHCPKHDPAGTNAEGWLSGADAWTNLVARVDELYKTDRSKVLRLMVEFFKMENSNATGRVADLCRSRLKEWLKDDATILLLRSPPFDEWDLTLLRLARDRIADPRRPNQAFDMHGPGRRRDRP